MRLIKLMFMEGISKGIPIITIPIIISLLSDESYALLGLYQSLIMVFFYFISLGSNAAVSKAFGRSNSVELDYAIGNLIASVAISIFLFVTFGFIFGLSSVYMFSFFGSISILIISMYRDISYIGKKDNYVFFTNPFFIFISQFFLVSFLYFYPDSSFQSKFFADLITVLFSSFLLYFFGFYKILKFKKPKFSLGRLIYSLKYSLPLSVRQSYPWLKSVLEREIFMNIYTVKVVSDYTLAFQISIALILAVNVYLSSKLPSIYSAINSRNYLEIKFLYYRFFCFFIVPPLCISAFTAYIYSSHTPINVTVFFESFISRELAYLICAIYLVYSIVYASQSLMVYFYNVNDVVFPVIIQYLMWIPMLVILFFNFHLDLNNFIMISLVLEVICAVCSLVYFIKSIRRAKNVKN